MLLLRIAHKTSSLLIRIQRLTRLLLRARQLWGGGGVKGQKKVCDPKIGLQFQGPELHFHFLAEENCSDVVGSRGWAGPPRTLCPTTRPLETVPVPAQIHRCIPQVEDHEALFDIVYSKTREDDIKAIVAQLDQDALDTLMKFIYKALELGVRHAAQRPATLAVVHDCAPQQGGGEIEVRNFPQFSAISQFSAIFRNLSQFSAIFLLCPSYVPAGDPCYQC